MTIINFVNYGFNKQFCYGFNLWLYNKVTCSLFCDDRLQSKCVPTLYFSYQVTDDKYVGIPYFGAY